MATPEPPADLIQLRRDFLAAEAAHAELCQATGAEAEHDQEHRDRVTAAFNTMAELAVAIAHHDWWHGAGNRVEAEKVLRDTAGRAAAA